MGDRVHRELRTTQAGPGAQEGTATPVPGRGLAGKPVRAAAGRGLWEKPARLSAGDWKP